MNLKATVAILALAGLPGLAFATGFALNGQNASGLGNAFAGQAASAQDASTVHFNPAGMLRIEGEQVVVVGHLLMPSVKLDGGVDSGRNLALPAFYYVRDAGPGFKFGLGVNQPFGFSTRDATQAAQLETVNVNPSLAWLYNQNVAIGAGLSIQRADLKVRDGTDSVKADSTALGYNLGVLVRLDNDSRVGLTWRSAVRHALEGSAGATPVRSALDLPPALALSLFTRINAHWDVLADLAWSGWGQFDGLVIRATTPDIVVAEGWQDTLRAALGANYRSGGRWLWRTGIAYEQTPVPDATRRTAYFPDQNRVWLALGGQYRLSDQGWVDFGYAHLFIKDAPVSAPAGQFQNRADLLSVQYTQGF